MRFLKTLEHWLKYFRIQKIIFIFMHNKTRAFILKLVTCHGFWAFCFLILSVLNLMFDSFCSQISQLDYQGVQDYTFNAKYTCIGKEIDKWMTRKHSRFRYVFSIFCPFLSFFLFFFDTVYGEVNRNFLFFVMPVKNWNIINYLTMNISVFQVGV